MINLGTLEIPMHARPCMVIYTLIIYKNFKLDNLINSKNKKTELSEFF